NATFEPSAYRRSIAEMFAGLDRDQQVDLAARVAMLPRHIHRLAGDGLIAAQVPEPRSALSVRGVDRGRAAADAASDADAARADGDAEIALHDAVEGGEIVALPDRLRPGGEELGEFVGRLLRRLCAIDGHGRVGRRGGADEEDGGDGV